MGRNLLYLLILPSFHRATLMISQQINSIKIIRFSFLFLILAMKRKFYNKKYSNYAS